MAELFLIPSPSPVERDHAARAAARDETRSFLVEAPAGSGKTGLLIQRFLRLLAAENVTEPEQIRAITFTRKATVEMRDRVLLQLQAAADGTPQLNAFDQLTRPLAEAALTRDRSLGWGLIEHPQRLKIGTIDSVCLEIARALPVLSRSGGGLKPTEDAGPLYTEAARRTLLLLGGQDARLNHALEDLLLHRDASLPECERLIASMLAWRDQWAELIPIADAQLNDAWLEANLLPSLNRALDLAICRGLTRLSDAISPHLLARLSSLAAEMGHVEGYNGNPSPIALCAGKEAPPEAKAESLLHWRALIHLLVTPSTKKFRSQPKVNHLGFMIESEHKKQLNALLDEVRADHALCATLCTIDSLPPAVYPPDQWAVTKNLFRVLSRSLVELQLVFAEHGESDFTEFALLASSALSQDAALEDLRNAAGIRLQHLLVDEMQDTSNSQYELIELLTRHWDGHSQTVFLVGDPKQSIYLFRQARVERFVKTMHNQRLGDLPLETLRLSLNFRSQAHLVDAFNQDFSLVFAGDSNSPATGTVTYAPVEAACAAGPLAARTWHGTVLPYSADRTQAAALALAQRSDDAQEIRHRIEDWLNRPLPAGRNEAWKIAVLVRSRSHLLEIVDALKQPTAIAYRAVEVEPLGERQEVLDLLALTRALLHPADRTAWLGLLRSPLCGITVADLHRIAGSDDGASTVLELMERRGELLSEDGIARLEPFYRILRTSLLERGQERVAAWVEKTWRAFRADLFLNDEQRANVETFLDLLDSIEQPGGRVSVATLTARLDKLYARAAVHPGAVDLMTIHGAKGLEWDVVFLPALERKEPSARARLLNWLETEPEDHTESHAARGVLAPIQGKGNASEQLNRWMRSVEQAREAAERKRLFYVACTRARQELHLFASPALGKDGQICIASTSLLAAAWSAAQDHLHALPPTLAFPSQKTAPALLKSLAATESQSVPLIERIPLEAFAIDIPGSELPVAGSPRYARPEGSFAARAFGNTVHAMLEQVALRLATGITTQALQNELPTWQPRIFHLLRAQALPPTILERMTQRVLLALHNTLSDDAGRWLLAPHPEAASEKAVAFSGKQSLRMDRSFLAGSEPLSVGNSHLWIVDFKTAEAGGRDLEAFLETERVKYEPQMIAYSEAFQSQPKALRVALYYPLLQRLIRY